MSTLRFRAMPLTPIHVGTGDIITPEDYLIHGNELIRFNPHAVLRDMNPAERREYEKRLEGNEIQAAQRLLQQCCKPERHGIYRSQIGAGSKRELQNLIDHPERRSEVHPLQRNLHTGAPVIPGSSIKGAMRTAIVNKFSQDNSAEVQKAVYGDPDLKKDRRWERLEEAALNYQRRSTESDPLRMLKVADVSLPLDTVRVDQATILTKDKPDRRNDGRQMHYERLLSRADGMEPPTFTVEIDLNKQQSQHPEVGRLLGRLLDWPTLISACNLFYIKRMAEELRHFFLNDERPEARYGATGLVKWTGEKLLIAKSIQERGLLLRLGRFSHFESLSVDDLRQGWNAQKRKPITGMGSARTLCEAADGKKIPFGWLLLTREDK